MKKFLVSAEIGRLRAAEFYSFNIGLRGQARPKLAAGMQSFT
jgi:hypothetical protein